MPAYFIALCRSVHDRRRLEEYWSASPPTFQAFGAKHLAIYTPLTLLENSGQPLEVRDNAFQFDLRPYEIRTFRLDWSPQSARTASRSGL